MRSQASRAILSIAQNVLSIYLANLDGRLARIIPVEIRSALLAVESPDGIIHIKEQLAVPFWGDGHVEIVRSSFVVWFKHGLVASRGSDTGNHFECLNAASFAFGRTSQADGQIANPDGLVTGAEPGVPGTATWQTDTGSLQSER